MAIAPRERSCEESHAILALVRRGGGNTVKTRDTVSVNDFSLAMARFQKVSPLTMRLFYDPALPIKKLRGEEDGGRKDTEGKIIRGWKERK